MCTECGVLHGYLHVNERSGEYDCMDEENSVHRRVKWMRKRLRERGGDWSEVGVIVHDFNLTVNELRKHILRNISRYDYYVMSLSGSVAVEEYHPR